MFYPSAPLLPILPSAPEQSQLPDDDTVSIRTYASTPPPFPDDGKLHRSFPFSKST